jgi:hypothetical protein
VRALLTLAAVAEVGSDGKKSLKQTTAMRKQD